MSRDAIHAILYMMGAAFEGDPYQSGSMLNNLKSVRDDDWFWLPDGGKRSIYDIVEHVGANKYIYDNNAFGDGSMKWENPGPMPRIDRTTPPNEIVEWMREGHRRLRASVDALADDAELMRPRPAPWGMNSATRWLINGMIQHDLYHAGEINHLRALHHRNDE
jgi:DinB superfamily